MNGKKVSIFLRESDEWQHRPLYLEILRMLVRENIEYASVVKTIAGFAKSEDMKTAASLIGVSGYQPLIVEFADTLENVERALARVAEMTADSSFSVVDVEIRPRSGIARGSS